MFEIYTEFIEYKGREYEVGHDLVLDDPREWNGNSEPAMYILGGARTQDPMRDANESHELIELFETLYTETFVYDNGERFHDRDELADYMNEYDGEVDLRVLEAYDDWLNARGTQAYIDVVNKLNEIEGLAPGDVLEVHPATGFSQGDYIEILCAGSAGNSGSFGESAKILGQWIFGSTWWVEDVETGDAIGGIFADFADEAVEQFADGLV